MRTPVPSLKLTPSAQTALHELKNKIGNHFLTEQPNMATASGHTLRNEGAPSQAMKHATGAGVYSSSAEAAPLGFKSETRFQIKQPINTFKTETKDKAALRKQKPRGPAEREAAVLMFTHGVPRQTQLPVPGLRPSAPSQRLRQIRGRACLYVLITGLRFVFDFPALLK